MSREKLDFLNSYNILKQMIRCIIFDFWGTLIIYGDEEAVYQMRQERAKRFKEELRNYGFNFSYEKVWKALEDIRVKCTQIRDTTHKEITASEVTAMTLKELNVHSNEMNTKCAEIYSNILLSMDLTLQDGAPGVLELLKKDGLKVGLISNTEHGGIESLLLKNFGIWQYFDSVIFSCDVGKRKPAPEIFKYALNSLSVQPVESVYVGDWPEIDVLGAKRAGMGAIYLKVRDAPYPKELPVPDATIQRLNQIPEILAKVFL